jgi:hypothetical protein
MIGFIKLRQNMDFVPPSSPCNSEIDESAGWDMIGLMGPG